MSWCSVKILYTWVESSLRIQPVTDVAWRIGLAAGIVRNLGKVWKAKDISKATKVLLYQTLIQSVISYNSETWTLKEEHKRKLRVFKRSVLRKVSGVTRKDHV